MEAQPKSEISEELVNGMTTKQRPELGSRHSLLAFARRESEGSLRCWASCPLAKPLDGMYIGYRHVYNGIHHSGGSYDYGDGGPGYLSNLSAVEVWLFVVSARKNPIRVLPQDVKAEKGE